MKVKFSKRMLCAVLSLILAFTSLPAVALAYERPLESDLREAIKEYEAAMDGTIYKNMSDAYNKYMEAQKIYDQYYYGKLDNGVEESDVTRVTGELKSLTADMKENVWTPGEVITKQGDEIITKLITEVHPTMENATMWDDMGTTYPDQVDPYFNNILSAKPLSNNATGSVSVDGVEVNVYHADTVVFYNSQDVEAPVVPVVTSVRGDSLYSLYPSQSATSRKDSTDISLGYNANSSTNTQGFLDTVVNLTGPSSGKPNYWIGTKGSTYSPDVPYIMGQIVWWSSGDTRFAASNYKTGVIGGQNSLNKLYSSDTDNKIEYAVNGMKVSAPLSSEYTKEITPNWYVGAGSVPNKSEGFITNDSSKIYVVNYDALVQAVMRNSQKLCVQITDVYADGGLTDVINAFEEAMQLDISQSSTYDYAADMATAVKQAGDDIEKKVTKLDSVEQKPDNTAYQSLRDAINNHRIKYEDHYDRETNSVEDLSDLYTNWEEFVTKYEAALTAMDDAVSKNYPKPGDADYSDGYIENISNVASDLNSFILLEFAPRVDTVLLEYTIDNAEYVTSDINRNFFDIDDSKAAEIKGLVKTAKEEIWGSEDHYLHERYKPQDDEEGFDLVLKNLLAVADSIRNIEVNLDAKVAYAGNYSYNSIIAETNTYIENQAQYANSIPLITAVNDAQYFANDSNSLNLLSEPSRQNYARDLADSYKQHVLTIFDAMNSLVPSFTYTLMRNNGAIIDLGTDQTTQVSISRKPNNQTHTVTFKPQYNNRIFLRTSTDAADFDLGKINITYHSGVNDKKYKYRNMLDSLNFNLPKGTSWNGNNQEWNKDVSQTTHPGNLVADTDKSNAKFVVNNIYAVSGGVDSYFGRHDASQSNSYVSNSDFDTSVGHNNFDADLAVTDGTQVDDRSQGGIYVFNNTCDIRADYTLHLDAANNVTLTDSTLPSLTDYTVDKDFGAVFHYHDKTTLNTHHGQGYISTAYSESAKVLDITPLTELINLANEKINSQSVETGYYTTDSVNALNEAVVAADSEFDVTLPLGTNGDTGEDTWMGILKTRYTNLWNALQGLEMRANFDNFTEVTATVNGNQVKCTSYDDAKYQAYIALGKGFYTTESVQAMIENLTKSLTYINMTVEERNNVSVNSTTDIVSKIRNEAQQLLEAVNSCTLADKSAYDANLQKIDTFNGDAYGIDEIRNVVDTHPYQDEVKIYSYGLITYSQTKIEEATKAISEAITDNWFEYTVKVIDATGTPQYLTESGSYSALSGDAKIYHYGDVATAPSPDGSECSFSATVTADGTKVPSTLKYMLTGTEYQFNVRGNTTIYTSTGQSDDKVKITFIDSRDNNVLAVDYATKGEPYTIAEAPVPKFAFQKITGYTNSDTEAPIDKTESPVFENDVTLIVNLEPDSVKTYTINLYNLDSDTDIARTYSDVNYNRKMVLNVPGAVAFVNKETDQILQYGSTYIFYAAESIDIKPVKMLPYSEGDVFIHTIKDPVLYNNEGKNRVQLVASVAMPAGKYTLKSYGFIADASGSATQDLTLKSVNNANKIYNLSCSKIIGDNQFAVSIGYGSSFNMSYVAYAVYTDASGAEYVTYSEVQSSDLI